MLAVQPRVQDGHSNAVTQGRTPPPSSHVSCKPIDEYSNALRGPCRCGDKAGVPLPTGHQSCYLKLAHPLNGGHIASSGCGKSKYKYKYNASCGHT